MRNFNPLLSIALALALASMAAAQAETEKAGAEKPEAEKAETEKHEAPPTAEELFNQGRDALFKGQNDKAIELLGQAVKADETKTSYRLHLARAYRYTGKSDLAAGHLEKIVKAAADHVEAGQMLGEIYTAEAKWKDVVRVLEPLLKYRHDYPTYHMLAEAQYNLGEKEKDRKYYEESVKLNPKSACLAYLAGRRLSEFWQIQQRENIS